jgi:hypothetical protein
MHSLKWQTLHVMTWAAMQVMWVVVQVVQVAGANNVTCESSSPTPQPASNSMDGVIVAGIVVFGAAFGAIAMYVYWPPYSPSDRAALMDSSLNA